MSLVCPSNAHERAPACRNFSRRYRTNAGVTSWREWQGAKHHMKNSSVDTDNMARLAAGDAEALRCIYVQHGRALLRFSAALCRSRQLSEDMVHDVFIALMRAPGDFDPARGSLFAYLCGVLRHCVSRHLRKERRWVTFDTPEDCVDAAGVAEGPADELVRGEQSAAFRRAVLDLPLQHREVIALCDLEELPYSTVAEILSCPIGTVRSRLHRARALLTLRLASLEILDLDADVTPDIAALPLAHRGLT
jgi:RNA polymerase sigma-70 factor, ECF subfamily